MFWMLNFNSDARTSSKQTNKLTRNLSRPIVLPTIRPFFWRRVLLISYMYDMRVFACDYSWLSLLPGEVAFSACVCVCVCVLLSITELGPWSQGWQSSDVFSTESTVKRSVRGSDEYNPSLPPPQSPSDLSVNIDPLPHPVSAQRHPKDNISLKEMVDFSRHVSECLAPLWGSSLCPFNWRGEKTSKRALWCICLNALHCVLIWHS